MYCRFTNGVIKSDEVYICEVEYILASMCVVYYTGIRMDFNEFTPGFIETLDPLEYFTRYQILEYLHFKESDIEMIKRLHEDKKSAYGPVRYHTIRNHVAQIRPNWIKWIFYNAPFTAKPYASIF